MNLIAILHSSLFPGIAVFAVAVAYAVIRPPPAGKVVKGKDAESPDQKAVKKLIERAIDAKARRDPIRAGWLYEQGHLWVKAAECFEAGGDGLWAAELFQNGGDYKRAGELYRLHGYPHHAAVALERGGFLGDAGVCYAVAGDYARAARLFQKADRPDQAAELYFRMGMYFQAGKLFQSCGDLSRAADAYEKMIDNLGRKSLPAGTEIAQVLERQGRIDATILFLEGIGEVQRALFTAMRYQKDGDAIRIYKEYREILAGPLLRAANEGQLAPEIMANLFERADDFVPAARMAARIDQWSRAARLYEEAQMDVQAAEAWVKAGEQREAALCYERAGRHDSAAELFLLAGETMRAIHSFNQAGAHYRAGRLYEELGEVDHAISSYQKVESSDGAHRDSRLRLARLVATRKRWDLAIDLFLEALSDSPSKPEDVDDIGELARCLAARERFGEAAGCWATIGRLDPAREGVEQAYERMRDMAEAEKQEVPRPYPYRPPKVSAAGDRMISNLGDEGMFGASAASGLVGGGAGGLSSAAASGLMGGGAGGLSSAAVSGLSDAPPEERSAPTSGYRHDGPEAAPVDSAGYDVLADARGGSEFARDLDESDELEGLATHDQLPDGVAGRGEVHGRVPWGDDSPPEWAHGRMPMGIEPDTDRIRQDDEPATDPAGIPVEAFGRAPEDRPLDHQPEPDAGDSGMSPALVSFEAFSGGPSEDFYVGLDGPSAAGPESLSLPGLGQDRLDPERQSSPDTLHPGIEGVMGDPAPVSGAAADDTDAISGMMTPDTYAPSTPTFGGPAAGGRPFDAAPPRLQANPPVTPPPQSGPYEPPALSGMTPAASMAARRPTMGNPLDSFGLFLDFQPREKAMLAQYLAPISAVAGQGLLAGDEDRDGLVLLVNGRVQVTQGRGASRTMNGPTFLAAEMLLSGDLPPIQATAESDVEAFILSREAARNLAEVDRPLAVKLAKTLRSVTAIG